jgi:hypothetical protein
MGSVMQARIWNVNKLMYQLALILSEIYIIGWVKRKVSEKGKKFSFDIGYWWFYVGLTVLLLGLFIGKGRERYYYSSYGAFYDIHSAESGLLYSEYLDRIEDINSQGPDAYVKPYTCRPWYLRQTDISENPAEEPNRAMADWYGKNSISLLPEEAK